MKQVIDITPEIQDVPEDVPEIVPESDKKSQIGQQTCHFDPPVSRIMGADIYVYATLSAQPPTAPPRATNRLPIDMRPAELYSYCMMS